MATASRDRAAFVSRSFTDDELAKPVAPLTLSGFDIIAEIKEESPSEGRLSTADDDREQRALTYAAAGAAAISVLTEPFRFAGEIGHLEAVVSAVAERKVPVMRKDFLVDTCQVLEARAAGASGVLLIAAILDDSALESMLDCAREHGMFVLLEAFDDADIERCCKLLEVPAHRDAANERQLLLGVNCRDLRSLGIDPERFEHYATLLPSDVVTVAESGVVDAAGAARVATQGYALALVGTALMRAGDPGGLIKDMLTAGRSA